MPDQNSAQLSLNQITCCYRDHKVVQELSLNIYAGDVCCLLGPSGCGKTTVLRSIAGFHPLQSGDIRVKGEPVSTQQHTLAPEKRNIGMVFQDYALFPHLSVCDNITYGLGRKSAVEKEAICQELLTLVKLEGFGERYPHELSGGQQQRVALARALAPEPTILLLDEPFSSLDVELRRQLAVEVRDILKSRDITAILVTHDQEEAFAFADKIAVMNEGRIQQWASPFDLYHEPANRFVANFIGQGSFVRGHMLDASSVATEIGVIRGNRQLPWKADTSVEVLLRPDDVVHQESSPVSAEIVHKVFIGASTHYTAKLASDETVILALPSSEDYEVGDEIAIEVDAEHLIAFPLK